MRKTSAKDAYYLVGLTLIFSIMASSCTAPTVTSPTIQVEPSLTATAISPTETPTTSATPDLRMRLISNDNGTILRPEVEINDKNFQQVELLGTLGSGTPVVVQFSPDDSLLAFVTSIGDVYIYDARTLELINTIQTNLPFQFPTYFNAYGICDPCGRIAISPDNKLLGILSIDGNVQIWDLESKQQVASSTENLIAWVTQERLAGVGVGIGGKTLRFSDDSQYVGIFGETIWWPPGACLYAIEEQCVRNFERPYFIISASGSAWSISLWCGENLCPPSASVQIQDDLSQFYDAFTFSHESTKLPPIPLPKTMNGKTHYQGKSYLSPKQQYISPDGGRALSYDEYGVVNNFPRYGHSEVMYAGTLWDVANNKVINTFSFPYVDVYAFSHDLGSVAYMSSTGITVLDMLSEVKPGEIPFANCLGKLTFSPDGNVLAGFFRNVIYFCDPLTGNATHTISVPTGFVSNIAFSPDGKFVASTGQTWGNYLATSLKNYDPFVYIWNTSDGKLVSTLEHEGDTEVVKFSPDGKYIAVGAAIDNAGPAVTTPKDRRFVLWAWDGNNANQLTEQEFDFGVGNLAFSPNSQQILIAANPPMGGSRQPALVYLYDITRNILSKSYHPTGGCEGPPNLLQFSPTGNRFLVGDGCGIAEVSISQDNSNPEFLPKADSSTMFAQYPKSYVSPNFSVITYADYTGQKIKISDIIDSQQKEKAGSYNYMSLTFSPDGKAIYGGSTVLGIISVWGIPVEK